MVLFRRLLGEVLRRHRQRQGRTLRDVAAAARISLGYLSEVERGVKEASSELLTALCDALGVSLADVLREISDDLAAVERRPLQPVGFTASNRAGARPAMRPVAGVAPLVAGAGVGPLVAGAGVGSAVAGPRSVVAGPGAVPGSVPGSPAAAVGSARPIAPVASLSVHGPSVVAA